MAIHILGEQGILHRSSNFSQFVLHQENLVNSNKFSIFIIVLPGNLFLTNVWFCLVTLPSEQIWSLTLEKYQQICLLKNYL